MNQIEISYKVAKDKYAEYGVDTDKALERLKEIQISLHCWPHCSRLPSRCIAGKGMM